MKSYFLLKEFFVTNTKLENKIPLKELDYVMSNLTRLINTLDVLRGLIGSPIIVTSGYRSTEVNSLVGGVKNSFHTKGRAADITCNKLHELLELCMKLKDSGIFEEVIYYPDKNFIHVAI